MTDLLKDVSIYEILGQTLGNWVEELDENEMARLSRVDEVYDKYDDNNQNTNLLIKLFSFEPAYVKVVVYNHVDDKWDLSLCCKLYGFSNDKLEVVTAPLPHTHKICNIEDYADVMEKYELAQREYAIKVDRWLLEVNPPND